MNREHLPKAFAVEYVIARSFASAPMAFMDVKCPYCGELHRHATRLNRIKPAPCRKWSDQARYVVVDPTRPWVTHAAGCRRLGGPLVRVAGDGSLEVACPACGASAPLPRKPAASRGVGSAVTLRPGPFGVVVDRSDAVRAPADTDPDTPRPAGSAS